MTHRLIALVLVLAAGAVAIGAASDMEAVPIRQSLDGMPLRVGAWSRAADLELDRATVDVLRADDYVSRRYARGGVPVDLFIAYYATQRQGDTIHSPMNCLPASGWQPLSRSRIQIPIGSGALVNANRYVIQKGLDQQLVLYWYQSHGRTIASEYASKVYLVLDSLRLHRSDAALVRVVAPVVFGLAEAETAAGDFTRALYPVLGEYIPD